MSARRNLLIGVGIGAVLGILFAPHKGSKTRKKIAKRGGELKDGFSNLKNTVSNTLSKSADTINDFIEEENTETASYLSSSMQNEWKD